MNDNFYFTKVVALPRGEALLCGHLGREQDEPTFTRLYLVSPTGWRLVGDMPDVVYGLARGPIIEGLRPDLFVLGRDGTYRLYSSGRATLEGKVPKKDVTYLEAAAYGGDWIYVCGGQNQVLRLQGGIWEDVSQGIYQSFSGRVTGSLEAMAFWSKDDGLFVGDHGVIYLFNQRLWTKIESPTNVNLLCAIHVNSKYFIGGADGVLLSMDNTNAVIAVGNEVTERCRIAAFARFQGVIYAAGTDKLFRLDGADNVVEVRTPNDFSINSIASIDAEGGYLWMTGGEQVLRFDGTEWVVLRSPDNK